MAMNGLFFSDTFSDEMGAVVGSAIPLPLQKISEPAVCWTQACLGLILCSNLMG